MRIVVLGAGVVGVATAWRLARDGHAVTVIDRQPNAAMETSFANGGQISVCHAEPWAGPGTPMKALKWLGQEDAPLLFRPRLDADQWIWGLRFLLECRQSRWEANARSLVALGLHSRGLLRTWRRELGLDYDAGEHGILRVFWRGEEREWAGARANAERMREFGATIDEISPSEAVAREPSLAAHEGRLLAGAWTSDDETGDARLFTRQMAQKAREAGVRFAFNARFEGWEADNLRASCVRARMEDGSLERVGADAFVVALGPHAKRALAPLGVSCPIYPAKGYSASFPLTDLSLAPRGSITDEARKMVFTRLGDRLRAAGTAEFTGFDLSLNWERCHALSRRAKELFGEAAAWDEATYWAGLRPSTPSNVPLIGRAGSWSNVWVNAGHGTLGWTHACGSADCLAELMAGRPGPIDFPFLGRGA
jgi:D-amino-acid dehydrogenase